MWDAKTRWEMSLGRNRTKEKEFMYLHEKGPSERSVNFEGSSIVEEN